MRDERLIKMAHTILNYSIELKKGEKVYIEWKGDYSTVLARELIKQATELGVTPFFVDTSETLMRHFLKSGSEEQFNTYSQWHLDLMKQMDAFVAIRGSDNIYELGDVPAKQNELFQKYFKAVTDYRIKKTKWVVMRFPNYAMAQLAEMPQEAFEDFYFKVCNADYAAMSKEMDRLIKRMEGVDKVRLVAPGTDLTLSIKDIPRIKCDGKMNIPDGEVFTAPVRDSINGVITYNAPSVYTGKPFNDVRFEFKHGKIVNATCANDTKGLNDILDGDEGARYCGEFAIGVNHHITKPMKDILFDEKIGGSIHLTPGQCYDEAPNGNNSKVHWDLVLIQTPEFGGGEMYFDGTLVRKDGKFLF